MDGAPHLGVVTGSCMSTTLVTWLFHVSPSGRICRRRSQALLGVHKPTERQTEMLRGLLQGDDILISLVTSGFSGIIDSHGHGISFTILDSLGCRKYVFLIYFNLHLLL